MRKLLCTLITSASFIAAFAQSSSHKSMEDYRPKFGIKAGYNLSYITGSTKGFKPDNNNGFMIGAFYAPASKGLGYRTEIIFSRQGYSFDNGGQNTDVMNDYIYLPQLTTFTIGKAFQLQLGGQIGYLLTSKASAGSKDSTVTGILNRFDYGFAGGVEVYPVKGLMMGARYNLGLGKLFKQDYSSPNPYPLPFNPSATNFKNGLLQLYAGYRF